MKYDVCVFGGCSLDMTFYAASDGKYPEEDVTKNIHFSRKLKADVWIDDRNVGGLPDWGTIYRMIKERKTYEDIMHEEIHPEQVYVKPKKKWWQF